MIDTMHNHSILLADCQAQSFDSGANKSGKYKGAQTNILAHYPAAINLSCGCHSLTLCNHDAAESVTETLTYFGIIQASYNLLSSNPKRWKILVKHVCSFLHGMSGTEWSDRVQSVKPFIAVLPDIKATLKSCLNLVSELRVGITLRVLSLIPDHSFAL